MGYLGDIQHDPLRLHSYATVRKKGGRTVMTKQTAQTCRWVRQPDYIEAHRFALKEAGELINALPHLKKSELVREIATRSVGVGFSYLFDFLSAPRRLECDGSKS